MSQLDKYIGNQLSVGDQKRERLAAAEREKKKRLQPGWNRLDPGNYDVIDGDTVRMRDTGALVRFGGGEGRSIDTFESSEDVYNKYPDRKRAHKKALSRITGRPEWMITTSQLVDRGRVQKAKLQEYLAEATQNGGVEFQEQGLTSDGRLLAQFRGADGNNQFIDNQSSRDENTTYDSKYNAAARFDDIVSGKAAEHRVGSGGRSLKTAGKDQVANLIGGGLDMANKLAHGLSIATRTNSEGVDQFFENNNDRVERFKKRFTSIQQQRRERLDQKQSEFNNQLYNVNYNKARKAGHGDTASKFLAGATEASNTIRNIIQDPGKVLDKTVESLPYMFGVGIAGRVAANTVKGIIQKEIFTKAAFGGGLTGTAATETAKQITAKWAASEAGKKVISKAVTGTAMTTVGFMEGLSTGAESYDAVMGMSEEEAMNSEKYQAYRFDKGLNHEDALKQLAEETFEQVTSTVIPMAMIAGKISGAAAFEGKIFTGAADIAKKTTKAQAKKAAAKQAERGVVKNTGAAIGRSLAPSARAGVQETIEESIQSGGGEFLAQLGEFDATGKEVGKGVGQATAEGGIIGFASGGGISLASRTAKALGQGAVDFGKGTNKLNKKSQKVIPVTRENGKDLTPGGSTTQTVKAVQSAGKNYDAPKALANLIKRFLDVPEGKATLADFNAMKLAHDTAEAKGQELIGDSKAAYDLIKANYEKTVADSVNALAGKADEDITDADIAYVNQAGALGLIAEETRAKLPERARTALGHSDEINNIISETESAEDAAIADGVIKGGKANVDRVHFEKYEDTINAQGHRGLKAYRREMTEAIQNNDEAGFMSLAGKFARFIASQNTKINELARVVETGQDSKNFKYIEGSSAKLLETMRKENVGMAHVRNKLAKQYLAWRPKAGSGIAQVAAETIQPDVVGADPAASVTSEQGGAATPTPDVVAPTTTSGATPAVTDGPDVVSESTPAQTNTTAPVTPDVVAPTAATQPVAPKKPVKSEAEQKQGRIDKFKTGLGNLKNMTVLKARAKALGMTKYSKLNRDALETAIAIELEKQEREKKIARETPANQNEGESAQVEQDAENPNQAEELAAAALTPDIVEETGETAPPLDTLEPDLATDPAQSSEVIDVNELTGAETVPNDSVIDVESLTNPTEPTNEELAARLEATIEAEDSAESQTEAESEAINQQKSIRERLSEAINLRKEVSKADTSDNIFGLTNTDDYNFVNGLLDAGLDAKAALSSLINELRPQVDASVKLPAQKTVDPARVNQAVSAATDLNQENGRTESYGINPVWPDFVGNAVQTLRGIKQTTNATDEILLQRVQEKFAERGVKVPSSIGQAMEQRSPTTDTLFSAVPNIMEILTNRNARRELMDALDLNTAEIRALDTYVRFYDEFWKQLRNQQRQLEQNDKDFLTEKLEQDGLYYFMRGGVIDPNVVAAMALESMNWLSTTGGQTIFNDEDAINGILGRNSGAMVSPEEKAVLQATGTLRVHAVEDIGKNTFKHLNLSDKRNPDIDSLFKDRLINSLGLTAISTLKNLGRIELHQVSPEWFLPKAGIDAKAAVAGDKDINFIRMATINVDQKWNKVDANVALERAYREGAEMFDRLFGSNPNTRMPSFREPQKVDTKVARSHTDISSQMRTRIEYAQKQPWKSETALTKLLDMFNPLDYLKAAHEYVDAEGMQHVHEKDKAAVQGRNDALERDLQAAFDWHNKYPNRDFFFSMKMIRSGRIYIDSNVINPQASKIHRFLFGMKDWTSNVPTDPTTEHYQDFLIAVGLGLGVKVDKLTRPAAIKEINDLLNPKPDALGRETNPMVMTMNLLRDGPADGQKFNAAEIEIMTPALSAEGTHTLAALNAWNKMRGAIGVSPFVEISLPMETDGITNGTAAGLLQTPPIDAVQLENARTMYHAVGIFFENDQTLWNSYQDFIADGGIDNYQSVANDTSEILKDMAQGRYDSDEAFLSDAAIAVTSTGLLPDIEALTTVEGRKWAKDPLMVAAYGASIASIIAHVIGNAEEKFRQNLAAVDFRADNAAELIAHELNKGYKIAHAANEESRRNGEEVVPMPANGQFTAADVVKLSQSKRIKPPEGAEYVNDFHKLILNFEMSPAVAGLFRNGIEATYGFALGAALDMKLAPMETTRKALNNANKLMNEIFVEDYVRRINTLETYRSTDDPNYVLSKDDRDKILQDMHNEGLIPAVATAQSNGLSENLELTNYINVPVTDKDRGKSEAHLNDAYQMIDRAYQTARGELGQAAPQAAITARVQSLVPNTDVGVSGVVKMIHSLDGVNNSYAWGNYPVLNVHDAQIGALHKAREISGNTNLDFVNMHANYSLAEEIHKSLARMTVLLRTNDNRLTAAAKDRIMTKFVEHLKKFKDMPESYRDNEDVVNQKIQQVGTLARRTNAARSALFKRMRLIHQFAIPGSEKQVTDGVLSDGPTTSDNTNPLLTNPALTADDLAVMQQEEIENSRTKIRDGVIESFVANLREKKGNINGAIVEYVRRHNPSAEDLMQVMANAYSQAGHPAGKSLEMLSTILMPHLGGVRTIVGTPEKGNAAEINAARDTIVFKDFSEVKDETRMVQLVIHELIHAANAVNLEKLETDNPVEFTRLLVRATDFANNLMKAKTGTEVSIGRKILELQTLGDNAGSVSEYMAYAIATSGKNTEYSQYFGQNKQLGPLMGDLLASLQDPNLGTNVLHSSNDRTSDELFADETAYLLEGDKMEAVIDKLVAMEQTPDDPAWSATLRKLATDLIIPGIKSAEPLYQAVAVNEAGSKNIGQIQKNVILLEAAGNKLSTNADMSLLETALHEYVHGFSRDAVENDHAIRQELRRLFDLARNDPSITAESFLPEGDTSPLALERAQERYDYIFNNPKVGYHEFLAIGLTNQPLALALTRVENKAAPEPIFNSGILQGLLNVFNRILQYVSKHSVKTYGGSVHGGLYALGQNIIANNQRNMQRIQQVQSNEQPLNRIDQMNRAVTKAFSDKMTDPLAKALRERRKANTPRPEGAVAWAKSITYSALRSKDKDIREGYNEVYRAMGGGKNNEFFQITGEFLPYNPDNLGTADEAGNTKSLGWIDLLRKSKVAVDMARQNMIEHTASYLNGTFDKNNYLSKAQKKAVTAVIMKTDLGTLMENDNMTVDDIQQLLNNPRLAREHIKTLRTELMSLLEAQGEGRFLNVFENQMNSLANIMIHGEATVENPMTNAHGIARRFNLGRPSDRRTLENQAEITNLIDRIVSLKAFDMSELGKIDLVRDIANHEMTRGPDNGFASLLGMTNDFKMLSQEHLFKDNPTQMMKGYVYEILDGDVNIEYVYDTPEERARMVKEGMVEVGPIPKDDLDPNRQQRILYKGLKGLATYNKSVVSLTDIHGRGTNLFNTLNQDSNTARRNLGRVRADSFKQAEANQFKAGYSKPGNNMVPILDEQGNIVDYRYLMSEQNKQKILKKEDPFDKVLPRMFATIPDRNNTVEINREVADLLWKEYQGLQDSREHAFVEIGPNVFKTDRITGQPLKNADGTLQVNKEARDMYNLLPSDMQRALREKFGSDTFYIRDDVVNLVMGFRKVSIANTTLFGKHTPIVRQAEKIWQEVMQHIRTTIVIRTPAVVVGNVASNTAMLLSEGISPKYIRDKGAEGIAAMRAYQKDVRAADELRRKIGADDALGKAKREDALKLGRLEANLQVNPVGKLVDEGLFTSIAEDLSGSDISMSGNFISTAVDKGRSIGIPKIGITAAKELYMLPGSQSFRAALAATQYGDFVARYVKFSYDTQVRGKPEIEAIHESLAAFIYYDMPQSRGLQFLNDNGLLMFTKFFLRIQPIIAKMYTQNPVSAFGVLAFQQQLLADPLNENIVEKFGVDAIGNKLGNFGPNLDKLDPTEPSLLQWILGPFGL